LGPPPGDDQEEVLYMPTGYAVTVNAFGVIGTLSDWQERIALKARDNPIQIASLCIGFAGPLLKFAGVEGGGFHLHSATSRGKTTAAQCGASIWGNGTDPAEAPEIAFVKKWNATFNSMEALAAERSDSLLTLDEIGESSAGDFGRTVYQLAGGQGKARLDRNSTLRLARTWRNTLLSTGEVPVEQHIESAGKKVRGGQLVRMVDIAGNGADGIIQDAHGMEPAQFVRELKQDCARYYGTAGPDFVEALCREGSAAELGKAIRRELIDAEKELTPKGTPAEVGRVVRRFALLLVAGRRACEAGILPLKDDEILKAIRQVLQRWLDVHGSGVLERAVEQLRAFLLPTSPDSVPATTPPIPRAIWSATGIT
jgi:putative DNA primase/helicase